MNQFAKLLVSGTVVAMIVPACASNTTVTPYKVIAPLAIHKVDVPRSTPRYEVEEMRVDLSATYDDPFDPNDVTVDATVTAPSGRKFRVPGFFYRAYTRRLQSGKEVLTPAGAPDWRVRFAPSEMGRYTVVVDAHDRTGTVKSKAYRFRSTPSKSPGFIRIGKVDPHYFAFDSGKTYFPVGANICWAGDRGTFDYDDWLPDFGREGCNYTRFWLAPVWVTFSTFTAGQAVDGHGYKCIDLANAWRLDHSLATAKANGMYVMLCLENAGKSSAYHVDSGGPLDNFHEFWTNPEVDKWYRAKLRYLVARYGADTHVFSWELWNEVDLVDKDPNDLQKVVDWHVRAANELRSMDPYKHLITTSFSGWDGVKAIDTLPQMDYVQTHLYHLGDLAEDIVQRQQMKEAYGKPEYTGETGADWRGPSKDDPRGEQIHQTLWASTVDGGSGAAAMWWWDNYTAPNHLWPVYAPINKFIADVDFGKEHMRSTPMTFASTGGDAPALIGWATAGHDTALAWVRLRSAGWQAICQQHVTLVPVSNARAVISGLAPGRWTAELWDTWKGTVMSREPVDVDGSGRAVVPLPTVDEDVAIKLHLRTP